MLTSDFDDRKQVGSYRKVGSFYWGTGGLNLGVHIAFTKTFAVSVRLLLAGRHESIQNTEYAVSEEKPKSS